MRYSNYNIVSKIKNSDKYYIINLLSAHADIIDADEALKLEAYRIEGYSDPEFIAKLFEKGYIVDKKEEERLYKHKYLDFIDSRESDEIQLFFVPNYTCNFACSYCYQEGYVNPAGVLSENLIDSFFSYITASFAARRKYITLFGGEPLLNSPRQKKLIYYFLSKAWDLGLEVCIVTNGYTLEEYLEMFKQFSIREIQVTLDGTEKVHNARRFLKSGGTTFEKIEKGVDACLADNITVNLRMVIDKDNISNLPEMAQLAIDKGWTESPFFKTQLGRNYELHHCQSPSSKLMTRISMYEEIYELIAQNPHILQFYKPAYSVAKFLSENGILPPPLFDSCPACKTEWAFDYTGHIYPCTATVGKEDETLGTFFPVINFDSGNLNSWQKRDVTEIDKCKTCNLQLACGGGCGSVAKNHTGEICFPDCRPIKELLELGFAAYF
jgi:uncharacterized protein